MPVGSPWPMNQHPDTARAEIAEARVVAVERDRDEIAIRCADDVASVQARVAQLEALLEIAVSPPSPLSFTLQAEIRAALKGQNLD